MAWDRQMTAFKDGYERREAAGVMVSEMSCADEREVPESLEHDWVFASLGVLLITNAFLMTAIYFTIRTFTTSLEHIETVPTYSVALLVCCAGILMMFLFKRQEPHMLLPTLVLCLVCIVLTVPSGVIMGIKVIYTISNYAFCRYHLALRQCVCYVTHASALDPAAHLSGVDDVSVTYSGCSSCDIIQHSLYHFVCIQCALYATAVLLCLLVASAVSHAFKKAHKAAYKQHFESDGGDLRVYESGSSIYQRCDILSRRMVLPGQLGRNRLPHHIIPRQLNTAATSGAQPPAPGTHVMTEQRGDGPLDEEGIYWQIASECIYSELPEEPATLVPATAHPSSTYAAAGRDLGDPYLLKPRNTTPQLVSPDVGAVNSSAGVTSSETGARSSLAGLFQQPLNVQTLAHYQSGPACPARCGGQVVMSSLPESAGAGFSAGCTHHVGTWSSRRSARSWTSQATSGGHSVTCYCPTCCLRFRTDDTVVAAAATSDGRVDQQRVGVESPPPYQATCSQQMGPPEHSYRYAPPGYQPGLASFAEEDAPPCYMSSL